MNFIDPLRNALEANSKTVWSVFLACSFALIAEHFFPAEFVGLPVWALPSLRLIAILFLIPVILSIASEIWRWKEKSAKRKRMQKWKESIEKTLLEVSLPEFALLAAARARQNRTILLYPDHDLTVRLEERGLITFDSYQYAPLDDRYSYVIPKDVWRTMLNLVEYLPDDFEGLVSRIESGLNLRQIVSLLPKSHPAVIQFKKENDWSE